MFITVTLSLFVCVCIIAPLLFTGVSVKAVADENGKAVARKLGDEGIVLLKNENNALPLEKGASVALLGEGQYLRLYSAEDFKTDEDTLKLLNSSTHATLGVQHGYVPWGAGSSRALGAEGVKGKTDPLDAFKEAHKNGEIKLYEDISKGFVDALENSHSEATYKEYVPTEAEYKTAGENADVAICFIRRWDGECVDLGKDKWTLSENEIAMLKNARKYFSKVIVVLNTPAPMDTSWAKGETDGISVDAVLFAGYGGMQGGLPICDVILGRCNPSGKLVTTYAKKLEDYTTTETFLKDKNYQKYTEDIFLGYRYFETFDPEYTKVNYEFGFGLSYTSFDISFSDFKYEGTEVKVNATVKNTGSVAGKEVVQLYLSAPQGKLGKAAKVLCAFEKTSLLKPGASETVAFEIDLKNFASFDDTGKTGNRAAYVLEAGEYKLLGGSSVKNIVEAGKAEIDSLIVVEQLTNKTQVTLDERLLADGSYEKLEKGDKVQPPKAEELPEGEGKAGHLLFDVALGKITLDEFVKNMTNDELATFFVANNGSLVGGSTAVAQKYGLNQLRPADGPSGIGGYGTSFPCETVIACTWNTELTEAFGLVVGKECYDNNIDIWLAPGMNLHRNPLLGRCSEYYSEDPYISGVMGMTTAKAVQSMGVSVCIKHFVCNEKEANKLACDSRVSERALREIYLKPFEITVKGASVNGVMSSYNLLNGIGASAHWGILTGILREEWGFKGYVSGDWNNNKDHVDEINAGNTVREPESFCKLDVVLDAIEDGKISRATLEAGAKDSLYVMLRSRKFYDLNKLSICGTTHDFDELGRCKKCNAPDMEKHKNLTSIVTELITDTAVENTVNTGNKKTSRITYAVLGVLGVAAVGAGVPIIIKKSKKKKED